MSSCLEDQDPNANKPGMPSTSGPLTDAELMACNGPSEAFDKYADGDVLKRSVRDQINDHMAQRGLSETLFDSTKG